MCGAYGSVVLMSVVLMGVVLNGSVVLLREW